MDDIEIISSPNRIFYYWELKRNWTGATETEIPTLIINKKLKPYKLIKASFNPSDQKVYAQIIPEDSYFLLQVDIIFSNLGRISDNYDHVVFKSENVIEVEMDNPQLCPTIPFSKYEGYLIYQCQKKYEEEIKAIDENYTPTLTDLEIDVKHLKSEIQLLDEFFNEYPLINEIKNLHLAGKTRDDIILYLVEKNFLTKLQAGVLTKKDLYLQSDEAIKKHVYRKFKK